MGGTVTWTGNTNTVWSTAGNWSAGAGGTAPPASDDDVIIPNVTNDPVLDADDTINSLVISSGGNFDGNGNELTIGGENHNDLGGYAVNIDGIITGTDTDITIVTQATTNVDIEATSGAIRNLTINHASCTAKLASTTSITGDLTITAGTLNTDGDEALTVTKHIDITGTLTGNASAISTGTMTIRDGATLTSTGTITVTGNDKANSPAGASWIWRNYETDGTAFAPSAGKVHFLGSACNGGYCMESRFYELEVEITGGGDIQWLDSDNNTLTISDDLTVAEGLWQRNGLSDTLTVTGDVSIEDGGTLGRSNATGANNFGSLTIASGGQYSATSGTTTLTSNTGTGTRSFYNNGGTFTHNKGKVKCTTSAGTNYAFDEDPLYDLEINHGGATIKFDGASNEPVTILNDFDIVVGKVRNNGTGSPWTVHGNVFIRGSSKWITQGATTNIKGTLTVENGAEYDAANEGSGSSGTLNVGGIRVL
tara:strand:+ start:2266 stop:3708 length:1443 start_codon:yes stop_codon:yes gene_type:complete